MNVLNDKIIKQLIQKGEQVVHPFEEDNLQPASIDLRLGSTYYKYNLDNHYILGEVIDTEKVEKNKFKTLLLKSNEAAFIGIHEKITIPKNAIGIIFPRSSITRLGIQIITTYMNPGYSGYMPLTIINHTDLPITLKPGYRVAQLILLALNSLPEKQYKDSDDTKYYNEDVEYSKLHTDKELKQMLDEIIEEEAPILHKMIKNPN